MVRCVAAAHTNWCGWSPLGGHFCEEESLDKSAALWCSHTYFFFFFFTSFYQLSVVPSAHSFTFPSLYHLSWVIFLSLYFSGTYSTFEQGNKTNPSLLPSFCLPALVKTLYPQYKFKSSLKYTFKFRQQFKYALATGQVGQGGHDSSKCRLSRHWYLH